MTRAKNISKIITDADLSGNLNMGDGDIIKLGASADLQIYHDGSNSIIKDNGTGALFIDGSNAINFRSGDGGEYYAVFNDDGAVSLRHNNVEKLATSSTGVTVTGNIANASGDLTIDVAGNIFLDADGGDIRLADAGTQFGVLQNNSSDFVIQSSVSDKDIIFKGNDAGGGVTALTLDMSDAGTAIFNNRIRAALASDGSPSYSFGNDTHTGMFSPGNDLIGFSTGGAERIRITTNGSLLLGKTSATTSGGGTFFETPTAVSSMPMYLRFCKTFSGTREAVSFHYSGSYVGGILYDNSSINYATSSDYRLKENVVTDWNATTRLKQLKPSRFNFKADTDKTVDGFLAHEVSSIVPEAITGTKDAVKVWEDGEELPDGVSVGDNKLDANGNTIPVMQCIDQSKLVPLLVKTIQELEARITALENA